MANAKNYTSKVQRIEMSANLGRLEFWQNTPTGISGQFVKGPDVRNEDHLSTIIADGSAEADLIGLDSNNKFAVGDSHFRPLRTPLIFSVQPNASEATAFPFFVNGANAQPLEVEKIDCIFDTADGGAAGSLTGFVSKEPAGSGAPGTGKSAQTGTFDLAATANTLQTATLVGSRGTPGLTLAAGEQLTFNISAAVASLKGLLVVVWVRSKTVMGLPPATYYMNAAAGIVTKTCYLNLIPGTVVTGVAVRWATKSGGTDATVNVTKDTGTTAPGAGTSILTGGTAVSVRTTANITSQLALTATAATLVMAAGDRLAVKIAGTHTALAGLVVTIFFQALTSNVLVIQLPQYLTTAVDQTAFIADASYEVFDHWATWSVAGTSVFELLSKDTGTTAPGAGTALLTDNTNTGIDTSATANTPVEGTLSTVKTALILAPGDRLGFKKAGAGVVGSLAGLVSATILKRF